MWCTRCEASADMSVTMAESKSMSAPRPSTPRGYSTPSEGAHWGIPTNPMLRSRPAATENNAGQGHDGHSQDAQVVLHAATLDACQQAAAFRDFLAGFVET